MADRYNTSARSPQELRAVAADEERRAQRRDGDDRARGLKRAAEFYADADRWDVQNEQNTASKSTHRREALARTQRRKDEFTAQYGSGSERDKARGRLGW